MAQQGQWSIGGYNLPDFGITEALGGALAGGSAKNLNNNGGKVLASTDQTLQSFGKVPDSFYQGSNKVGLLDRGDNQTSTIASNGTVNHPATNFAGSNNAGSGGGGGGDSELTKLSKMDRNPEQERLYNELLAQLQGSQGQQDQMINSMYDESYNYLNQAEEAVKRDLPSALEEAQAIFNTNRSQLDTNKLTTMNKIAGQETDATRRKEDANAAARRLLQEQQMGARQRFGGSSSAGQAATELQNVEMQRQMGQTNRSYGDVMAEVGRYKTEVESNFQSGLMQLEQQKQSAVTQAQRDFQNKLLEISNNRAQLGQAKASARLEALQNLRNNIFAIQQQNLQFQQTLQMQREQAQLQLEAYAQQASGAGSAVAQLGSQFASNTTTNPTNNYGVSGQQAQTQNPQLMGSIQPRRQDQYGMFPGMA